MLGLGMRQLKQWKKPIALAIGTFSLIGVGIGIAYWQSNQRQWCVQFASDTSQEVTYSRGCISPKRFKKWVTTT
jgi:hypothetical protein